MHIQFHNSQTCLVGISDFFLKEDNVFLTFDFQAENLTYFTKFKTVLVNETIDNIVGILTILTKKI